ncbi:hypothetical protein [Alkalibacterium kapii]|uniref:Uncharacterized protein n=1 Tax=Alkalibacterium kapii TaxID=426704 RepID=A0A511AV17_9LACT|nr:hypothetical protein [Alkalibacterium kapii]GEK92039.1 hypothetical protein AKA01nite_16610 [Alkalibacterium kapii]
MHGDFKYNLMRINLLKLGEERNIKLNDLDNFFLDKGISDVSDKEIKDQLDHLTREDYLSNVSENEYKLTDEGKKELDDVKTAIKKF